MNGNPPASCCSPWPLTPAPPSHEERGMVDNGLYQAPLAGGANRQNQRDDGPYNVRQETGQYRRQPAVLTDAEHAPIEDIVDEYDKDGHTEADGTAASALRIAAEGGSENSEDQAGEGQRDLAVEVHFLALRLDEVSLGAVCLDLQAQVLEVLTVGVGDLGVQDALEVLTQRGGAWGGLELVKVGDAHGLDLTGLFIGKIEDKMALIIGPVQAFLVVGDSMVAVDLRLNLSAPFRVPTIFDDIDAMKGTRYCIVAAVYGNELFDAAIALFGFDGIRDGAIRFLNVFGDVLADVPVGALGGRHDIIVPEEGHDADDQAGKGDAAG